MRIIPKIMSEETAMFRYFSCKFKLEPSKMKTARIVLFKEFGIMNSFTIEASFHAYISNERVNIEFFCRHFERMGEILGNAILQDQIIWEEEALERLLKAEDKKRHITVKKQKKEFLQGGAGKTAKITNAAMFKRQHSGFAEDK